MFGYTTLLVRVVGHCRSHEIHVKVTNKTVIGFWAQFINGVFFSHLGLTQIPSIQIDGLKYEVLRSSNPRSFFNQIWPSTGHRIVGKFRWRFSQTFVIQVCIVEEVVSTWIVCFLWNHYCIVGVHSKFWNQEWLVTSIQFELLAFWISMLFSRFIWAKSGCDDNLFWDP